MAKEEIQLAPAAGHGIGKLLADALLTDPEFLGSMKAAFMDALKAESRFWDKDAKCWEVVPDFKTRLSAACSMLAHMEGEPIKRVIHQHLNTQGGPAITEALRESPALVAQIEREIEKARFRDRNKRPAPVAVLEVD